MAWHRSLAVLLSAAVLAMAALMVQAAEPPQAKANVACDVGLGPADAVTGAFGIGSPAGDACNAVTDPVLGAAQDAALGPLKDAASSIGQGVFNQITSWATDGAVWLLGEVVALTNRTTTPNLLSKGFLHQYREMAQIAVVLALLMLVLATLEGLGRGNPGMLWRVFLINVPVAALATSAAFVVVQLLVATTDGLSGAIAHSTGSDTREFFAGAVKALGQAGGDAGAVAGKATGTGETVASASGTAAVPLFVGFIAAMVAAFGAFLVWIELLMRSAAIYAVALFMPLAIAASIWPRWASSLRRTVELVVVVVFSKFVIVAIIALAASLLANTEGEIEHVLSAGALLLLACFSPFVLFKLVPFAQGAVSAAYSRQGAGGASIRAANLTSPVQMMRRAAHVNWGGGGAKAGTSGSGAGKGSGAAGAAGGVKAAGASGGAGVAALPVVAGVAAAKASKAGVERLTTSSTAQASPGSADGVRPAASEGSPSPAGAGAGGRSGGHPPARPSGANAAEEKASRPSASAPAAPAEAKGGSAPVAEGSVPRPSGAVGPPPKPAAGGEVKR